MRRHLPKILLVLVVIGLLVFAFRPRPLLVDAEAVSCGPVVQSVTEEGRTRVVDRYVISAPMTAQARRITLEAGDSVRTGDVLAVLEPLAPPPLDRRSVAQGKARVQGAKAALEAALRELDGVRAVARLAEAEERRLQRLAEDELVSPRDVEAAEAEARRTRALERSAMFRAETARHELEAARAALEYVGVQDPAFGGRVELRAPVAGEVLRRYFESSRVVQPGEPILEIGDPAALEVEVDVLSSDAVRIAPGMRVLFERWGLPEALEGRVRRVEPGAFTKVSALGVEEQRVWVVADIVSPRQEWARLGDAYRVNARFILFEAQNVLRVPTSALFRHGEGWAAFVVEEGRARLREVATAERGGRFTRVLKGVEEGEAVIVHPPRQVEDGIRVRTREE